MAQVSDTDAAEHTASVPPEGDEVDADATVVPSTPESIAELQFRGQRIGGYVVDEMLGQGGMGTVHVARHPALGRKQAVKFLHIDASRNRDLVTMFINEARAAASLGHPNIIEVTDVSVLPSGVPYMVMEHLEGQSLQEYLTECGAIPLDECLEIALQVCRGLAAAHASGIVHRDLKPANVFLRDGLHVTLLDFGVAKFTRQADAHEAVDGPVSGVQGGAIGTPAYMSPEQARGLDDVDLRSDLYSLAVMMYLMLTGALPRQVRSTGDLIYQMTVEDFPDPRTARPECPAEWAELILEAASFDASDRPESAELFARRLVEGYATGRRIGQRVAPEMFRPSRPTSKPRSSRRTIYGALSLVGALVASGIVLYVATRPATGGSLTSKEPKVVRMVSPEIPELEIPPVEEVEEAVPATLRIVTRPRRVSLVVDGATLAGASPFSYESTMGRQVVIEASRQGFLSERRVFELTEESSSVELRLRRDTRRQTKRTPSEDDSGDTNPDVDSLFELRE